MSVYHKADPGELIQWVTPVSRSSAASNSGLIRIGTQPRTADAWHHDSCRPRGVVTRDFSAIFDRLFDRLPVRISTSDLHHWILRKKTFHIRAYDFGVQFSFNINNNNNNNNNKQQQQQQQQQPNNNNNNNINNNNNNNNKMRGPKSRMQKLNAFVCTFYFALDVFRRILFDDCRFMEFPSKKTVCIWVGSQTPPPTPSLPKRVHLAGQDLQRQSWQTRCLS